MANKALDALNEFVVVASHDGRIQAIDARDGHARWTQTCGHSYAGLALAQVGHEVVAVSGDGYVCVLALDDGTVRWEVSLPLPHGPVTTPIGGIRIAANQQLVAVQLGGIIFALALDDGHTFWEARPSPTARQWWLLAAGEQHIYTLQKERSAARPRHGTEDAPPRPPAAFAFVTTAFSAWDGTPHWFAHEEDSAAEPPWDGGSSLVEEGGVVYAYSGQGLRAFETASGAPLWTCDMALHYHIGALALSRDFIAVAANRVFGAYRRDTGTLLWSQTAAKRADGYFEWFDTPLVLGDAVCVGRSSSGGSSPAAFHIESYEGETGALRWVWSPAADSGAVQVDVSWRYRGAGATLYVPSRDVLWGIHAADGRERWHLSYDFRSGFNALLAVSMTNS
ncbi:MAG TPA: PQQ-binding-like beta-propeller repeat protein [Ktedonobacterales bacterium]|nr:PQQ-binding-like beta-propeller repeat protein [Ktedonobacterales bacterium]